MRLRTPRRRSDRFSQVRAAPRRPTHQLRVAPSPLPPSIGPYDWQPVSDCSDIRLSQAVSGCCEEHTAAGRSVLPAFNVSSSAQLNQRTRSEVLLLPPSPPCKLSDGHSGFPRTRHEKVKPRENAACIGSFKLARVRCSSCLWTRYNQLKVKDCWWS